MSVMPKQCESCAELLDKNLDLKSTVLALESERGTLIAELAQAQVSLAAARERDQEVLKRWIVDANEGRIKFGTRELTNDELALIGDALRCVAADMKAAELKGEQRP